MTEAVFRIDPYQRTVESIVTGSEGGMIELERTVFYPTGGGQPGDTGRLILADRALEVVDTRKGGEPGSILHVLAEPAVLSMGTPVQAELDWDRRHRLMRMHTCLHLLCKAVDGVVTGGQIGDGKGRLDFDIPEAVLDKEVLTERLNAWIAEDHAVTERWIEAAELDARPELVKTMSVQPPRTGGRIRLVEIEGLDLQACGGTHVRSTGEIGRVSVAKIEKKGRQNRRVQVVFDEPG
ncbi:MAG: alanyl-tRNA editing protein [Caldilinea sp.]